MYLAFRIFFCLLLVAVLSVLGVLTIGVGALCAFTVVEAFVSWSPKIWGNAGVLFLIFSVLRTSIVLELRDLLK